MISDVLIEFIKSDEYNYEYTRAKSIDELYEIPSFVRLTFSMKVYEQQIAAQFLYLFTGIRANKNAFGKALKLSSTEARLKRLIKPMGNQDIERTIENMKQLLRIIKECDPVDIINILSTLSYTEYLERTGGKVSPIKKAEYHIISNFYN